MPKLSSELCLITRGGALTFMGELACISKSNGTFGAALQLDIWAFLALIWLADKYHSGSSKTGTFGPRGLPDCWRFRAGIAVVDDGWSTKDGGKLSSS